MRSASRNEAFNRGPGVSDDGGASNIGAGLPRHETISDKVRVMASSSE